MADGTLYLSQKLKMLANVARFRLELFVYGFARLGHFVFEHNKPAIFQFPSLNFIGDRRMWWEMLIGKIRFY
jgi:hypothetical protein